MKIAAVIPCRNEAYTIHDVVKEASLYVDDVIVADDHSMDGTVKKAESAGALIIESNSSHRGAGANTKRGIEAADADIIVTLDGDGQHLASEIPNVLAPILSDEADLVIGSRFMNAHEMPRYRKFGNNIITWLYNFGKQQKVRDSQSCFRAYTRGLLDEINIEERSFGFSTEMLIKARAIGFRITEVPVSCVYHNDYARDSSMGPIKHGLSVAWTTIKWRAKTELRDVLLHLLRKLVARPLGRLGIGSFEFANIAYRIIVSKLVPEECKLIAINGFKLIVRVGGCRGIRGIAQALMHDGCYEPETTEVFRRLLKPNMKVVDVGANIGYYTVLSAKLVEENGIVYAFEPEDRNFKDLVENVEFSELRNVVLFQKAVSDTSDIVATLHLSKYESGEHSLIQGRVKDESGTVEIETVRLDDAIDGEVDFLKTDTEGNELAVLRGAKRILSNPNIKLVIEIFPEGFGLAGHTIETLWKYIEERGFEYIYLIDDWKHRVSLTNVDEVKRHTRRRGFSTNILCAKVPLGEDEFVHE